MHPDSSRRLLPCHVAGLDVTVTSEPEVGRAKWLSVDSNECTAAKISPEGRRNRPTRSPAVRCAESMLRGCQLLLLLPFLLASGCFSHRLTWDETKFY